MNEYNYPVTRGDLDCLIKEVNLLRKRAEDAEAGIRGLSKELIRTNDFIGKASYPAEKTLTNCSYEELAKEMWRRCAENTSLV